MQIENIGNRAIKILESRHFRNIFILVVIMIVFAISMKSKFIDKNNVVSWFAQGTQENESDEIKDGDVFEQDLPINSNDIKFFCCNIRMNFEIEGEASNVNAILKVVDDKGVVAETQTALTSVSDNEYYTFTFAEPALLKKQEDYKLLLEFENIDDDMLSLCYGDTDVYKDLKLTVNGKEISEDITLNAEVYGNDNGGYRNVIIFVIALLAILTIGYYILSYIYQVGMHILFAFVVGILGLIYLIVIPVYAVPDEPVHVYASYAKSNQLMGVKDSEQGVTMRDDDCTPIFRTEALDKEYMCEYYDSMANFKVNSKNSRGSGYGGGAAYSIFGYVYYPSAIGMTIARIFGLSTIWLCLLGRFFNLLFFVVAGYFSIKYIPFGKGTMFVLSLFPMTLQQVASFSYDSVVFALTFIVISFTLSLAYDDNRLKHKVKIAVLVIAALLLIPIKNYALTPISLLPLFIVYKICIEKVKKFENYFDIAKKVILVLGILLVLILFINRNRINVAYGGGVTWSGEVAHSLNEYIHNPISLIQIFINTLKIKGEFYISSLMGSSLGWFRIIIPQTIVWPFFALIMLSAVREKNEKMILGNRTLFAFCVISLLGVGLAFMGMLLFWTPVSYNYIEGVQGRYLIPFILLPMFLLRKSKIQKDRSTDNKLIFIAIFLQILVTNAILANY